MTANSPTSTKTRRAAWPSGPDLRLLIVTGLCAILAGLMVAVLILVVSDPTEGPEEGEPIVIGSAAAIEDRVAEEGAFFLPDPLGGGRSVWMAEEDGELVALSTRVPGTADCYVDDTGTTGVFEDCEGNEVRTTQLDRYRLSVKEDSPKQGALLIEFDRIIQAPANVEK